MKITTSYISRTIGLVAGFILLFAVSINAQKADAEKDTLWTASRFAALSMRNIGPALMAGRIADIAIDPENENVWYVAVGSGGLWKTENAGITWTTPFDDMPTYSLGCVTIDPSNSKRIWLGTGENVGGRHVGYGDGIYLSEDAGKSWKNLGLKKSEHISKIIVHPENSDVVWVAAQGPLWKNGGERGLYMTTDGGATWTRTLGDDDWVGATDLVIDPRNPDVLYAATWQRHRTVSAYMGGGPGTALHKSTDGGKTWTKLSKGLPTSNMGKIGLAISPQQPDVLYAAIELDQRKGGLYKSTDQGASWTKQSDAVSGATGPHYYQELYASPHEFDKIYLADVRVQVSDDGGKTFRRMKEDHKHSDNHAIAFRKNQPDYLLVGTDGGLYETFDAEENWRFFANMPITQFYKLAVDDTEPFYNVFGGTQDNSTQGGPSRTDNVQGIRNADWKVVLDWDGHQPATEPGNPDIMYGQRQEGTLSRIDMRTGEVVNIQPQAGAGEDYLRFNWDAPIVVSPHKPTRIYSAAQRLYRSDNRGDSWEVISDDLTRNEERIALPIMGGQQSWDNPWDFLAMSNYNSITSVVESPVQKDLLYVGTDDGLFHMSPDGGASWTKLDVSAISGVPERAYVNNIIADLYDANTVYMALDNHKAGDFKPYLFKSTNKGKSWTSMSGDLPDRHLVWRIVQDHEAKDLFFIGTEFGIFFTTDAGKRWTKIEGGMPTIAVRDLTIQRKADDLVVATFGRSFYILDDIAPFREINQSNLEEEAHLFPLRDAYWYIPRSAISFGEGKADQGAGYFTASNPPVGAVFTYHLRDGYKTKREVRQKSEKQKAKEGEEVSFPGWDALLDEEIEQGPKTWLVIKDEKGEVVRKLAGSTKPGFHRLTWDMRWPSPSLATGNKPKEEPSGMLVPAGTYSAQLLKEENGIMTALDEAQTFKLIPLREGSIENPLAESRDEFWKSYSKAISKSSAFNDALENTEKRVKALAQAYERCACQSAEKTAKIHEIAKSHQDLSLEFNGNPLKNQVGEKNNPTVSERLFALYITLGQSTYGPTPSAVNGLGIINDELNAGVESLKSLDASVTVLGTEIYAAGGPPIEGVLIGE